MSSQKTEHYELNQWLPTDQVLRTDFNADNAKIDAALNTLAGQVAEKADAVGLDTLSGTVAGHTAQLAQKGNCQIWTTTYQGNGQYGSSGRNSVTFPTRPLFAIVYNSDGILLPIPAYTGQTRTFPSETLIYLSWSGTTVSWYSTDNSASYQLNAVGSTYFVIAFYAAN